MSSIFRFNVAAVRLLAAAAVVGSFLVGGASAQPSKPATIAAGRLLVAPAGDDDQAFHGALAAHGARSRGRLYGMDVHMVDVPPGFERGVANGLARNPHVRFAEPDEIVPLAATVNDPNYGSQWHLPKISAPLAWDATMGAGVTVAIIDTGVDGTHPDLANQMVAGWNFYNNNSDSKDVYGHGTAVAGAAAARSNNAIGVAGVAGAAKIMPIRVSDANGYAAWSAVAQALLWAADRGARVANISYVGVSASSTVISAASTFRARGGVVVVCAGNTGTSSSTAPTGTMIVVGATTSTDQRSSFSTFGSFVDMSAPGSGIVTTGRGGVYQTWNGTSLASPIVAGTAALVLARRPDLTADQVEAALLLSATDLGTAGYDIYFGAGRVNAYAAVQRALAMPASDTIAPSVAISSPTGGTVSGTVTVTVTASDNVGVARVELRVNGQLVGSDTAAPFSFAWNTTGVANGTATLTAIAYDAKGNAKTSAPVSVNVSNAVAADTAAPALAIVNPKPGSRVSNRQTVTTSVSDDGGTAGITQSLYIDGQLKATSIGAPLAYKWDTKKLASGKHTVSVTARDKAGNATTRAVDVYK